MNKLIFVFFSILLSAIIIFSCAKQQLTAEKTSIPDLSSSVPQPNVQQCSTGYHWDYNLNKCVANNCLPNYHWDDTRGTCVPDTFLVVVNSNNPYDYVGQQHNDCVDYILNHINVSSPTIKTDIIHFANVYAKSLGYDTSGVSAWYTYVTTNAYYSFNPALYVDSASALNLKLYNNGKISSYARDYLNSINSAIDNTIATTDSPNVAKYRSTANQLVTIETQVVNDNRITSVEKEGLLSVAAIYRYDGAYWANYLMTAYSRGGGGTSRMEMKVWKIFTTPWWKKFWKADGTGALTGGAAGALGGWTGVLWGVLIGGASNSAAYAIFGD